MKLNFKRIYNMVAIINCAILKRNRSVCIEANKANYIILQHLYENGYIYYFKESPIKQFEIFFKYDEYGVNSLSKLRVITKFYKQLFLPSTIKYQIRHRQLLANGGLWLYCDATGNIYDENTILRYHILGCKPILYVL